MQIVTRLKVSYLDMRTAPGILYHMGRRAGGGGGFRRRSSGQTAPSPRRPAALAADLPWSESVSAPRIRSFVVASRLLRAASSSRPPCAAASLPARVPPSRASRPRPLFASLVRGPLRSLRRASRVCPPQRGRKQKKTRRALDFQRRKCYNISCLEVLDHGKKIKP